MSAKEKDLMTYGHVGFTQNATILLINPLVQHNI